VNEAALAAFGESGPAVLHLYGGRYAAEVKERVVHADGCRGRQGNFL
jgi:hypothetical protein